MLSITYQILCSPTSNSPNAEMLCHQIVRLSVFISCIIHVLAFWKYWEKLSQTVRTHCKKHTYTIELCLTLTPWSIIKGRLSQARPNLPNAELNKRQMNHLFNIYFMQSPFSHCFTYMLSTVELLNDECCCWSLTLYIIITMNANHVRFSKRFQQLTGVSGGERLETPPPPPPHPHPPIHPRHTTPTHTHSHHSYRACPKNAAGKSECTTNCVRAERGGGIQWKR